MANQVISMQQIRAILQLLEKGVSLRGISAQLNLSRPTVTSYARRLKSDPQPLESLRRLSNADLAAIVYGAAGEPAGEDTSLKRQDFLHRVPGFLAELKRTGVTRLLLWEEYCKTSNDPYGYTQFCVLLKEALSSSKTSMHLHHAPGAMVMVDFAGDKMSYVDSQTGEVITCPVLVAVLPYSKYTFAVALRHATIPHVIHALNRCLEYFGGVPLSLKTDNMKQVVNRSCRYEPVFTQSLQQWALHYDITLLATRVAKPKDKAAVENEVKIAYQRIYAPLRDQMFHSLQELNIAITQY